MNRSEQGPSDSGFHRKSRGKGRILFRLGVSLHERKICRLCQYSGAARTLRAASRVGRVNGMLTMMARTATFLLRLAGRGATGVAATLPVWIRRAAGTATTTAGGVGSWAGTERLDVSVGALTGVM